MVGNFDNSGQPVSVGGWNAHSREGKSPYKDPVCMGVRGVRKKRKPAMWEWKSDRKEPF